jgi:bifunctional UDP-N-acetylglucosamine pyrophosphorylase/glucosamine-1-phosphate N-acetyltransferase
MQTDIVILAAGHGKRMQSDIPKVLSLLHGKPLVHHLLESVVSSGVCETPVFVVGQKREMVMSSLGDKYKYAIQQEQLGTGHAVLSSAELLEGRDSNVMILYGDMPHLSAETIRNLAETQGNSDTVMTMATVKVPDFDEWRAGFFDFSRVLRDENGKIIRTVEKKDAQDHELLITEVNPCYLCVRNDWLWKHLRELKNANNQKEYYLTDLIKMAVDEGAEIGSIQIDPKEALGVNTKEHLEFLEKLF